ncbi:MAG: hypothetical protein NVS9B10_24780 [Nevskia sp.]
MPIGEPSLADILLGAGPDHAAGLHDTAPLVGACVALIERHVADRGGFKGIALKTGLAMAKAAKPQILTRAAQRLLPEFALALEPLYRQFRAAGEPDFAAFLLRREPLAVAALLTVADRRIADSPNAALKTVYGRLRGGAETEVGALLPGLAGLIAQRLPSRR